jgi:manganese/iron transport system ATP-binding protein
VTTSSALILDHVCAAYEREPVLTGVNGSLAAGSSLALIGPNGAGKSTLIKAILGLVPLVEGSVEVLGTTPARARREVAYVPQADTLDAEFPVTVLQVAMMGRYRHVGWLRRPGAGDRRIAMHALDEVGLAGRAKDRFGVLSGGQRQRVLLARAVAQEAKLLLLDEPFNGVDTTTTQALLAVLERLRASGVAVVMSTHDLSVAHLACDEACLLNRHQVAFGPIGQSLTSDLLQATYGGSALLLAGGSTIVAR